jgi:hypothetical protein
MRKSFRLHLPREPEYFQRIEQERRTAEVQAWATQQIKDGRNLDRASSGMRSIERRMTAPAPKPPVL